MTKSIAKSIYETLEDGTTNVTIAGKAIEVSLPESLQNVGDIDDLDQIEQFIQKSPYKHEFLQYAIKGALRYFRSDIKKKNGKLAREAAEKWEPKRSRRVQRKVAARQEKVEAWKAEGLSPEEILERLINEV